MELHPSCITPLGQTGQKIHCTAGGQRQEESRLADRVDGGSVGNTSGVAHESQVFKEEGGDGEGDVGEHLEPGRGVAWCSQGRRQLAKAKSRAVSAGKAAQWELGMALSGCSQPKLRVASMVKEPEAAASWEKKTHGHGCDRNWGWLGAVESGFQGCLARHHGQEREHGVGGGPTNTCAGGKNQQILEMDDNVDTDTLTCCPAGCHWGVLSFGGCCCLLLANGVERERAPLCRMYEDTKTDEGMDSKSANIALEMKPQMAQESDAAQKEWRWKSTATSSWKAAQCHESQGKPSSGERSSGAKKTAGTTQWGT
ncbi:hypothetical protein B0H10DRAFT_1960853 [Mycena sp. CBHHK59/15]|nr:hypothetical protein B0H10DRAFT_1960853 [Mycena sp. CBHHK59/15]